MSGQASTAVAPVDIRKPVGNNLRLFQQYLESRAGTIGQVCAKHLSPDRLTRVVLNCVARTPALQACSMVSIYRSVIQAAELGLEPGNALGDAYLVPYRDTCQLIVGYRGLIALARRSGEIETVQAFCVYEGDDFDYELGTEGRIRHKPAPAAERTPSKLLYVYAIAYLRDTPRPMFDVMTRAEVEAIRSRSKAGNNGPWVSDYGEMARKTVVRRLAKYLPMSTELNKAMALDAAAEGDGQTPAEFDVIDVDPSTGEMLSGAEAAPAPTRGVDAVRSRVASQKPADGNPLDEPDSKAQSQAAIQAELAGVSE